MELSAKEFKVLDTLDRHEITTQRQLSEHAGISLGQVNYVLKNLLQRGLVKLGNFRKNPRKIGYAYLLTPKGIETRSSMAARFVLAKLQEYQRLQHQLKEKLSCIEIKRQNRIIFVGPSMIKDFIESTIKKNRLNLVLAGWCRNWEDLKNHKPDTFDVALLCNSNTNDIKKIKAETNIPRNKLLSFW
jgi:EPS-associated MarR family transcriptional regulator